MDSARAGPNRAAVPDPDMNIEDWAMIVLAVVSVLSLLAVPFLG